MLTKDKIISNCWAIIAELDSGILPEYLATHQEIKLRTYAEVLEDDIPEDLLDRMEEYIIV